MRKLTSCGVLVTRGNPIREFLLMKHATRWDLPKGHVDPGESEHQCALRELWEETSIQPDSIQLDPGFRFVSNYIVYPPKYDGKPCAKTLIIFWGRLLDEHITIVPTEHPGFDWITWSPPHQIQPETIDPLLNQFAEFLRTKGASGAD